MSGPIRYKLTLSPPTDGDPPTAPIWSVDDIIGVNPPGIAAPQIVSVWTFLTAAQKADVIARTESLDVTGAFQEAIDYVAGNSGVLPMGYIALPSGAYRIEDSLISQTPIMFIGAGQGRTNPPWPANSRIAWYGGAAPMMIYGGNGAGVTCGGGFSRIQWDGRSIATYCWKMIDCAQIRIEDSDLANAVVAGWFVTNTPGNNDPTGFWSVSNVTIFERGGGTNAAHGVMIETPTPAIGSAGATLSQWDNVAVQHANGAGFYFNGGDNHQFNRCYAFRAQAETGPGIHFASVEENKIEGGCTFIDMVANGGVQVDSAGNTNDAIYFLNFDDGDLWPGVAPFFGNGIGRVIASTHSGRVYGQNKTLGYRETIRHDSMHFVAWNTPILNTNQGNWFTDADAVADAFQPGGAVVITNTGVADNTAALYDSATLGTSGISTGLSPHLIVTFSPIDVINSVHRVGLMDGIADPPVNGIYVEIDPDADNFYWRAICTKEGSGTTVLPTTTFNYGPGQIVSWRIEVQDGVANFYWRVDPFQFYTYFGQIATNVPLASKDLNVVCLVIGRDSTPRSQFVYDVKLGFNTES